MILRRFFIPIAALATLWVAGCGSANPTVATIGDEVLTQKDFEESYAKNNGG